jgi:hypothetical protein
MMEEDWLQGDAAGVRHQPRLRMSRVVGLDVVLMPGQRTTRVSSLTFTWVHFLWRNSNNADEPSLLCLPDALSPRLLGSLFLIYLIFLLPRIAPLTDPPPLLRDQ